MAAVQIYSASAGSGKTFTLVKEYLKILFKKADVNHFRAFGNIMAITFTNKATDEMKRRVIEALKQIAAGHQTDLLKALQSELPEISDFKVLADKILIRLLRDFSNFNIQTIDSFFQDIIRSFARELNLPLNFEVELNKDAALEFAVDELVSQIGIDKEITSWLMDYAQTRMKEDKGWNFKKQVTEISGELFDENIDLAALEPTAARISLIKKDLSSIITRFENTLSNAGKAIIKDIEDRNIPMDAYAVNWRGNIKKAISAYQGLNIAPSATYFKELTGEKSPMPEDRRKKFMLEEDAYKSEIYFANSKQIHELLTGGLAIYLAAKEARTNIYALGVIHQLNEFLKKYRTEKNILFIVDAARLLAGFISLDGMPFLFEKIGSRIEYLFIDEFQDTSTAQWNNMLPLIRNILATSGADTSVMLVGDAKQSIYRWRGGDYRLITGKAAESISPFKAETIRLDINYRSLPEVVEFNNRFFSAVRSMMVRAGNPALQQELHEAYEHVEQQCAASDTNSGHVSIELIEKDGKEWKTNALQKLDGQIEKLQGAGYAYHDMAILVKTRKEGIEISRHLQRNGIEVVSIETLLLKFDPDVKLLIAALYFINEPGVPLNYTNLVWQYANNKDLDTIDRSEILSNFKERSLLQNWLPELTAVQEELAHLSSYQTFERLISLLNVNESGNLFLGHLRQILFDFFRKESTGLKDFLQWWEENRDKASIFLEGGENKINIMTIHKAKGLEFPAVMIPFCDWNFYEMMHNDILWLSDESFMDDVQLPYRAVSALERSIFSEAYLEERKWKFMDSINVLYVAMTRARDSLYISLPVEKRHKEFPTGAAYLFVEVLNDWEIPIEEPGVVFESGTLGKMDTPEDPESQNGAINFAWKYDRAAPDNDLHLRSSFENRETRIGNLVHNTLYFLSGRDFGELEEALTKARKDTNYREQEISTAKQHLERIIDLPIFKEWIGSAKGIWNEQDIFYKGNLYRPDKIVEMDDRLIIVDYKTGEKKASYWKQIGLYMEAVREIFPGKQVDGYILYTENGILEQVTD